ncbi:MAG TPA: 2-phospho-L-lactate transferase [Candidatus Bathyarchaeia archaeon]
MFRSITCLAGGVGAARFLDGLSRVYPPDRITVIVNTGDDLEYLGAYISPDIDILTYTLAGIVDEEKGWGIKGDTYRCMEQLERYSAETWFRVGDRDFATHLLRTAFLQQGFNLSEVTEKIRSALGVKVRILPMSNDRVATKIKTSAGLLEFQEYFVKRKFSDKVEDVTYEGANHAVPPEAVLSSLKTSEAIILCPSNPILSIGPILAIPGIREALGRARGKIVGISPIVGGKALKGPLDRVMADLGLEVSPYGVAKLYQGVLDGFVIDEVDKHLSPRIQRLGMKVVATRTVMNEPEAKTRLAEETVKLAEGIKK